MGTVDRIIRTVIALAVFVLVLTGLLVGLIAIIPLVLAIYLIITGNIAFCPAYKLLGRSTKKQ